MIESLEMRFADITDKTLKRKKIRETARAVLPNCTETKIFVTGNARAWRHFLELRGSIHADAEIQRLAIAVLDVLQAESPNLFGDYTVTDQGIETKWRKV
jgi:thymidylate synthase (FAD)